MKVLTLTQPWATLVAVGAKHVETRSWRTSYRGRLAIHAAKAFPKWAREFSLDPICYEAVRYHGARAYRDQRPADLLMAYPTGSIVATCTLADCIPTQAVPHLSDQEREFGDYSPGRFAWILQDIRELTEPIVVNGKLGLWDYDFTDRRPE